MADADRIAELEGQLRGALRWLHILIEEMDIDPMETCVRVNAVNYQTDEKREIAVVCLGEAMERYRASVEAGKEGR